METQTTGHRFVRSVLGVLATNFGVAALSLGNVLIVSRVLGPAGRGDVAFVTTVTNLAHWVSTCGVQEANVNLASRERSLRPTLATNSLLLGTVLGGLAAGLVALLVVFVPAAGGGVDPRLLGISLAFVPVLVVGRLLQGLATARFQFAVTNAAWIAVPVVNLVVTGLLAAAGALSVPVAVASWLAGQALGTALLVRNVRRHDGFGRPSTRLARSALGFGLKSHAGQVLLLGNYRLDQWLVGAIAGARQLGLYSVAVAWAEMLFYLPTAVAGVQRPTLARSPAAVVVVRARNALHAGILLTLPALVGVILLAPLLITGFFGTSFSDAVPQLRVLAVGSLGIVAIKLLVNALTAEGRPLRATAAVAVGFVTMVVLDVALIPGHGGLGASIAASISYLAGGAAICVLFARAHGISVAYLFTRVADVPPGSDAAMASERRERSRRHPDPVAQVHGPEAADDGGNPADGLSASPHRSARKAGRGRRVQPTLGDERTPRPGAYRGSEREPAE